MSTADEMEAKESKKLIVKTPKDSAESGIAHDDVDFTSGFEKQYEKEYLKKHVINVQPPDPELAWYRSGSTILMILFLMAVFLVGSIMLVSYVFTSNPWSVFLITATYIVVATGMILLEVYSIHVR